MTLANRQKSPACSSTRTAGAPVDSWLQFFESVLCHYFIGFNVDQFDERLEDNEGGLQ